MAKSEFILSWSPEEQVLVAKVPELHGAWRGARIRVEKCERSHALWVDTAKEFGDAIPQPNGRRLMLA